MLALYYMNYRVKEKRARLTYRSHLIIEYIGTLKAFIALSVTLASWVQRWVFNFGRRWWA